MSVLETVLPGDIVPAAHPNLKLGPGLVQLSKHTGEKLVLATRAGQLKHTANGRNWWIEANSKRYIPAAQESIIGVVMGKTANEGWRIDIGAAHQANLDGLAFEGATKRNRPVFKTDALVYARVSLANKDMEPELECFNAQTRRADDYGELKGGFLVKCSLGFCRSLLEPNFYLLPLLGSRFPLEIIVGVNGRVWFKSPEVRHSIAVARCLEAADPLSDALSQEDVVKLLGSMDL